MKVPLLQVDKTKANTKLTFAREGRGNETKKTSFCRSLDENLQLQ